jgi:hypothetical protein
MYTDMPRQARKWLSVLDDVLDTDAARDLIDPSTGGGGPRSGLCYIASRVSYELLRHHHLDRWTAMRSKGHWGSHWWLRHNESGEYLDFTADQYEPAVLAEIRALENRRAAGFVPNVRGGTMCRRSTLLLRMVEAVYASRYGEEE